MSRPMLLVFLLIVLIITSQFEWKQPLVIDQDTTPNASEKQLRISERQESIKEKIILSQRETPPGSQKQSSESSRTVESLPKQPRYIKQHDTLRGQQPH